MTGTITLQIKERTLRFLQFYLFIRHFSIYKIFHKGLTGIHNSKFISFIGNYDDYNDIHDTNSFIGISYYSSST